MTHAVETRSYAPGNHDARIRNVHHAVVRAGADVPAPVSKSGEMPIVANPVRNVIVDDKGLVDHAERVVEIDRDRIVVKPGVFDPDPAIARTTTILLEHLPSLSGKRVIDIGTGSGVIARACARQSPERVVAVDIDQRAVENARINLASEAVEVYQSDLFENVEGTFDYAFANLPIVDSLWNLGESALSIIDRCLDDARSRLEPGGWIYLTWISKQPTKPLVDLLQRHGYRYEVIAKRRFGHDWLLFKATPG